MAHILEQTDVTKTFGYDTLIEQELTCLLSEMYCVINSIDGDHKLVSVIAAWRSQVGMIRTAVRKMAKASKVEAAGIESGDQLNDNNR